MMRPFDLAHPWPSCRSGPLLEDRLRYLSHRAEQGMTRFTLWETSYFLRVVTEVLRLGDRPDEAISGEELKQQALLWSKQSTRRSGSAAQRAYTLCLRYGTKWLRHMGRLQPSPTAADPHAEVITAFADYLRHEKGLVPDNIYNHSLTIRAFLDQLHSAGIPLREVTLSQIDDTLLTLITAKRYKRASVQRYAGNLRTFFRYAELAGLCRAGLDAGVRTPRVFTQASLPTGPTWDEVQQMFALIGDDRPADLRDRALLLLLAVYGLRSGEIIRLRLDDFDWDREVFTVTRPKSMRSQPFPLSPSVAAALIRYLKDVRPRTRLRELFVTRSAPFRPINKTTVFLIVARRLRVVCPSLPHHGPHALRHACATHLLNQGLSLKEIGDYLGHCHPDTTRIYTKVDLRGLRRVAEFDLGGLL
ncbi:MAG TPA: tyrosine-type recombinase/integrase [Gemmataceae bacterium]|nr:tyrosine-type recombinase/integrase [Gemmataceae bacterium]